MHGYYFFHAIDDRITFARQAQHIQASSIAKNVIRTAAEIFGIITARQMSPGIIAEIKQGR